jgi:hypothetical protein
MCAKYRKWKGRDYWITPAYHVVLAVQTLREQSARFGESRGRASLDSCARRDPKEAGNPAQDNLGTLK